MDDTLIRKRGRKVYGTGWKRDPLGPSFCSNFVWGQRFLQISAALPDQPIIGQARGIPIDLTHAPSWPTAVVWCTTADSRADSQRRSVCLANRPSLCRWQDSYFRGQDHSVGSLDWNWGKRCPPGCYTSLGVPATQRRQAFVSQAGLSSVYRSGFAA